MPDQFDARDAERIIKREIKNAITDTLRDVLPPILDALKLLLDDAEKAAPERHDEIERLRSRLSRVKWR